MELTPPPSANDTGGKTEVPVSPRGVVPPASSWVLLTLLVLMLTGMQLVAYLEPAKGGDKVSMAEHQMALDHTMRLTAMSESLAQYSPQAAPGDQNQAWKSLKTKIERDIPKSDEAARLHLLIGLYLKDEAHPAALKQLGTVDSAVNRRVTSLVQGSELEGTWSTKTAEGRLAAWLSAQNGKNPPTKADLTDPQAWVKLVAGIGMGAMLFLGGLVTVIFYAYSRLTKKRKLPGFLPSMDRLGAHVGAARVTLYMTVYFFVGMGIGLFLIQVGMDPTLSMVATSAGMLMILPVLLSIPMLGRSTRLKSLVTGKGGKPLMLVTVGFLGYLANFVLAMPLAAVMSQFLKDLPRPSHEAIEMLTNSPSITTTLAMIFLAAVYAPIIEEIMFRGQLFPALKKFMPLAAAIALQGIIFAVIHPQGPLLWPSLAVIGMTSAVLAEETGSLVPSIVMHALHNGTLILLNLLINT